MNSYYRILTLLAALAFCFTAHAEAPVGMTGIITSVVVADQHPLSPGPIPSPQPTKVSLRLLSMLPDGGKKEADRGTSGQITQGSAEDEIAPTEHDKLVFTDAGELPNASALVTRMLEVNKPWLDPTPVAGSYLLEEVETHSGVPRRKQHGPYSIIASRLLPPSPPITGAMSDETRGKIQSNERRRLLRVGATVVSPLDYMWSEPGSYTLRMLGRTEWRGRRVIGVEVDFNRWVQCRIGMGPTRHGSNDGYKWAYGTRRVRLLIEPEKALPLLIIAYTSPGTTKYDAVRATTWEIEPEFYEVDGGLAPRSLRWRSNDEYRGQLRDRLDFQVIDGAWIFKQGEMRSGGVLSTNREIVLRSDLDVKQIELKSLRLATNSGAR